MKASFIYLLMILFFLNSCDMSEQGSAVPFSTAPLNPKMNHCDIAIDSSKISRGQLLFVATYSGVQLTKKSAELVGSNLSIRNTSRTETITLKYVDFYDDHGALHENYLEKEEVIQPMGSKTFHIHQYDEKGGSGSNFLVEWSSDVPVSPPYVENVSYRLSGAQGLAFTSPAIVLRDRGIE